MKANLIFIIVEHVEFDTRKSQPEEYYQLSSCALDTPQNRLNYINKVNEVNEDYALHEVSNYVCRLYAINGLSFSHRLATLIR